MQNAQRDASQLLAHVAHEDVGHSNLLGIADVILARQMERTRGNVNVIELVPLGREHGRDITQSLRTLDLAIELHVVLHVGGGATWKRGTLCGNGSARGDGASAHAVPGIM